MCVANLCEEVEGKWGGKRGFMSKLFFPKLKRVESMHNLQVDCTFTHNSFSHGIYSILPSFHDSTLFLVRSAAPV
jgi:hypothetical protein